MAYTDIDDPTAYFQTKIYTGNGSGSHAITLDGSEDMQPDWVWIKKRNGAVNHLLHDSVRGVTKLLVSNTTGADDVNTNILLGFDSNGFRVGSNSASNNNGDTFVAWNWKAGTSFTNDASSTGIGTIDSAGSFNNDSGFSIVSYTGTGSNGTIKHGLNIAPKMMILKDRDSTQSWSVYHKGIGYGNFLGLNNTNAAAASNSRFLADPTTSVFNIGDNASGNGDGNDFIAYCFADVKGYSKFGSYTGNGNVDGTFVYTGFKPAFVITKVTSSADGWMMFDNKRDPFNVMNKYMTANGSGGDSTRDTLDFLSNGFKLRTTNGDVNNGSYIYMAFAENPFVTSSGVPATAR